MLFPEPNDKYIIRQGEREEIAKALHPYMWLNKSSRRSLPYVAQNKEEQGEKKYDSNHINISL
jgi:hypothetical protein